MSSHIIEATETHAPTERLTPAQIELLRGSSEFWKYAAGQFSPKSEVAPDLDPQAFNIDPQASNLDLQAAKTSALVLSTAEIMDILMEKPGLTIAHDINNLHNLFYRGRVVPPNDRTIEFGTRNTGAYAMPNRLDGLYTITQTDSGKQFRFTMMSPEHVFPELRTFIASEQGDLVILGEDYSDTTRRVRELTDPRECRSAVAQVVKVSLKAAGAVGGRSLDEKKATDKDGLERLKVLQSMKVPYLYHLG